jgi:Mg2+-importing ATPase
MFMFGPVSSLFDFITFGTLFFVFKLTGHAFQTGWFLESLATQSLVVHIIRSPKLSFSKSRPSLALVASTLVAVFVGGLIVFSRIGDYFNFTILNFMTIFSIIIIVAIYLLAVEMAKKWFYLKLASEKNV